MPSSEFDWARELRDSVAGVPTFSRYEIRDRIGEGATSVVYRAWDRKLGRPVALKVLRVLAAAAPTARERFEREGRAAAVLSHPNVVTLHDAGEENGALFLVLELVEGKPLGARLEEQPPPPLRTIVEWIEGAARGVAAAHERGIIHRDLKPGNILVTSSGVPKVCDFGLSHLQDSAVALTRSVASLGTPLYMAPEQAEGRSRDVTPRTDVYALGAILYEALTGRPPHMGETAQEIYAKILRDDAPAPTRLNPAVPKELETIALRGLEKNPARRYPDARAFADDLRRYLEGQPILATPTPRTIRAWRWVAKRRTAVLAALVSAVILAWVAWEVGGALQRTKRVAGALGRARQSEAAGRLEEARDGFRSALDLEEDNAEARQGYLRTDGQLRKIQAALADKATAQEAALRKIEKTFVRRTPGEKSRAEETAPAGDVVFSEDFEDYNLQDWKEYPAEADALALVEGGPRGKKCLCLTSVLARRETTLYKSLPVGLDQAFLRFYLKVESDRRPYFLEIQFLGWNPPSPHTQVRRFDAPPKGDKHFSLMFRLSPHGSNPPPGIWETLGAWCDMSARADGKFPAVSFPFPRFEKVPQAEWVCVELMLKCNTEPDRPDGEHAVWINGRQAGRWTGTRWRSDPALKINAIQITSYLTDGGPPTSSQVSRAYLDEVVVSKSYVGPLVR